MMRAEPERGTPLGMFEREGEEAPDVRELWAAARVGGEKRHRIRGLAIAIARC